jgi:hypothetical protein
MDYIGKKVQAKEQSIYCYSLLEFILEFVEE